MRTIFRLLMLIALMGLPATPAFTQVYFIGPSGFGVGVHKM